MCRAKTSGASLGSTDSKRGVSGEFCSCFSSPTLSSDSYTPSGHSPMAGSFAEMAGNGPVEQGPIDSAQARRQAVITSTRHVSAGALASRASPVMRTVFNASARAT